MQINIILIVNCKDAQQHVAELSKASSGIIPISR